MNEFDKNNEIEKYLEESADQIRPNLVFKAELEEKLRAAHRPKKNLQSLFRGIQAQGMGRTTANLFSALTGIVALAAVIVFMVWIFQELRPHENFGSSEGFVCPVTPPNGSLPPGETVESQYYLGNGELWTTLWPDGKIIMQSHNVEPDGSFAMKWSFVRGDDVSGALTVEGQRLDAEAEPLRAFITDGYGDTGLQILALIFPTPGCWEVTGRVGKASLTFVTEVVYQIDATPVAEATPGVIIDPNATPSNASAGGYDFRGGKLFLAQPLPESPTSANVYAYITDAPATAEQARALADQFGLQGDLYTTPFPQLLDRTGYVISDGKRLLTIYTANYFTYSADVKTTSRGFYGASNANAESIIRDFLTKHGFDFAYRVSEDGNGMYSVHQLSPDGMPMMFDTFTMWVSRITLGKDGEVAYAEFNLMNYDPTPIGSYGIINAQDALDAVLSGDAQTGTLETGYGPSTEPPLVWHKEYPDNENVTISASLTKYDSTQNDGRSLLFLDGIQAIGETAELETLNNYMFVVVTGQFVFENGVRKFSVEELETSIPQMNIAGSLRNESGEIIIRGDGGDEYIVLDPPTDLPLNTDTEKSYLNIGGILTDGKLDWSSIQFYADINSMGGGGGGGGYGFYPLNLSGTPIPFPTLSATEERYTPEELAAFLQYSVKDGDTLESIAAEFNISVEDIMSANYLTDHEIGAGWVLVLPGVPAPARFDGVEGVVEHTVFVKPDGRERTEYTFILKENGQYYHLEGENLDDLLGVENLPVAIWGSIRYDTAGFPRLSLERFEELYPGLEFQVLKGNQEVRDYNGTQLVLFNHEGETYVQLVPSGASADSNYYPDGEILIQALIVPGETFAGYPTVRVFYSSPAIDPSSGQPLELPSMADMDRPLPDPFGNNDNYVPPDLVIETVELVYYAMDPLMQYDSPGPASSPQYVQPVWHLHGRYTNGGEADILVQALKREFLSPLASP